MGKNVFDKYYLGDGENYFKYRRDKYNWDSWRATLYDGKGNMINDICTDNMTHHQVINYFEIQVMNINTK